MSAYDPKRTLRQFHACKVSGSRSAGFRCSVLPGVRPRYSTTLMCYTDDKVPRHGLGAWADVYTHFETVTGVPAVVGALARLSLQPVRYP